MQNSIQSRVDEVQGYVHQSVRRYTTVPEPVLTLSTLPTFQAHAGSGLGFGELRALPWESAEIPLKFVGPLYPAGQSPQSLVMRLVATNPQHTDTPETHRIAVVTLHWKRTHDLAKWMAHIRASVVPPQEQPFTVDLFVWNNNADQGVALQKELLWGATGQHLIRSIWLHHSKHNVGPFGEWILASSLSNYFSHVVFIDDDVFVGQTGLATLRADARKFPEAMLCGWGWYECSASHLLIVPGRHFDDPAQYWRRTLARAHKNVSYCGEFCHACCPSTAQTTDLLIRHTNWYHQHPVCQRPRSNRCIV